jgi:hypothetical protein
LNAFNRIFFGIAALLLFLISAECAAYQATAYKVPNALSSAARTAGEC